ncbi:MAG: serine/threonine protein kinase [Betaproteobacteria bacterium]|nr:MAG: serine/threonine protein kinase [Betaproteobacteria bacterium]
MRTCRRYCPESPRTACARRRTARAASTRAPCCSRRCRFPERGSRPARRAGQPRHPSPGGRCAARTAAGGAVPVPRALHILRQLCAGLAEAHARGLVHRDVKPENIMICRRGGEYDVVKILDFGLVKSIAEPHSRDITRSLRILGTPLYMAPERLRNPADVDARADIYAVGAVAFLLLTGRRMFDAPDDLALTTKVLNDEPPRVAAAAAQPVPLELDLLVQSCLEKKREDRPQRVTDLVEAFEALTQEHRWTQREAEICWRAMPPPR